jgi:4-amino-4-deoxy-L-arabinose transferase-like glycosyltransferase
MLETGNFITPTLNYVRYFEKPPLLYWINAASMTLFGQTPFAARLPSALAGIFTILATYLAGRRLFDRSTGLIAALILTTSAGFLLQSRIILTDMLLTLCLSIALFSFVTALREKQKLQERLFLLFFASCAAAVLAKGLIGIVLPGGIIFAYLLLTGNWRILLNIPWFKGIIVFAAITLPWFIMISLNNPDFLHFFFIREHFQRFTSTVHKRQQPIWFFIPILLITVLPWSFYAIGGLINGWKDRKTTANATTFLLCWVLVIFSFFSLSSSKLIPYMLPVIPPLAIFIARRFSAEFALSDNTLRLPTIFAASILVTAGAILAVTPYLPQLAGPLARTGQLGREFASMIYGNSPNTSAILITSIGLLVALPGVALFIANKSRSALLLFTMLFILGLSLCIGLTQIFQRIAAERLSSRTLASQIAANSSKNTMLAQLGLYHGIPFYTHRRIVTIGDPDELQFGSQQSDAAGWFFPQSDLLKLWESNNHMLLAIRRIDLRFLEKSPVRPKILADNGASVLISNR